MKKTLVITASLMVAVGAFAQGTINFQNYVAGSLQALIYDTETIPTVSKSGNTATGVPAGSQTYSGALLSGTGFTIQLWGIVGGGQSEGSLQLLPGASTSFRTGGGAGRLAFALLPGGTSSTPVPGASQGGAAFSGTFQIRVWANTDGDGNVSDWAEVLSNPLIRRGTSAVLTEGPLGGTGSPPAATPDLTGLTSFNLFIVPEPSLIALGALGLGALLLRRRKA